MAIAKTFVASDDDEVAGFEVAFDLDIAAVGEAGLDCARDRFVIEGEEDGSASGTRDDGILVDEGDRVSAADVEDDARRHIASDSASGIDRSDDNREGV